MHLSRMMETLSSFPEQSLSFYDEAGRVVCKPYPTVHADILRVIERLRRWGLKPGMRVGIVSTNRYEFVLHDLALMQLGCTSLVFPEEFGGKTSGQLIGDYRLNLLLIAAGDTWPTLSHGEWTAYMDEESPGGVRVREHDAEEADADDTPFVIFSSGTSGKIKGMVVNPRGVEETIARFHSLFEIGHADGLLVFLPLSSFQQRLMVYAAFFYGFDLYLVKPAQVFAGFRDFSPTLCLAPPLLYEGIYHQFTKALSGMGAARRALVRSLTALARVAPTGLLRGRLRQLCYGRIYSSLGGRIRVMWTGMAPIKRRTLDFFAEARIPLFEAYGLTECGVIASNTARHNRIGSVGRPIDEGSVRLAEDGEIIVRKENISTKGYVYYEEGDEPRTYLDEHTVATGDVGRFDEDGYLYLLGRKKEHIVTAQGYKVHPESLEGQLNACADVERSVVFGNGLPYLLALVSAQRLDDPHTRRRIERHVEQVNERLPPVGRINKLHLTSEQFTVENGLLTRNLKLNRREIFRRFEPQLLGGGRGADSGAGGSAAHDMPQTETERALAEIWRDVLKVREVGRAGRFLDLGGDSLLATQVLSRIRDVFGVDIPLVTFFEKGNLDELARCIDRSSHEQPGPATPKIGRATRGGDIPLSYAQQRLWFLQQLEPADTSYNEVAAVSISGPLDLPTLERVFREIVRRHEILRTTFGVADGRPFQVVHPNSRFSIRLAESGGSEDADDLSEVRRLAAEMAGEPFDLSRGPLMRASLLRRGPSEHVLILLMHHIIADGWSRGILVHEFASLYRAFVAGRPSPLPEPPLQYADFALWQRQTLQGEALEKLLRYWKQQLGGAPPALELPADRPRGDGSGRAEGSHSFTLGDDTVERLRALCREENVTLFMALLAAFDVLLFRYTAQPDLVVGTPVANRPRAELEPLIGFFANTLLLRCDLSHDPSFAQLLARVRDVALDAYAHQDVPFETLVEELRPERSLSHTPLFQVMFILQNTPARELSLPGLKLKELPVGHAAAKFDLTLSFQEKGGSVRATILYDTGLFDAATIVRMSEHCRVLLAGAAKDPSRRISALPLLSDAERLRLLGEWNETSCAYGPPRCVQELFEEQAARTPEHVAVVDEQRRLSYAELNARANQLARRLRKMGVGPEVSVGILLERSVEAVVAMLGTLKAGGAYVPLEPSNPADRWCRILADAGPAVIVSERRLAAGLPGGVAPLLLVDGDADALAAECTDDPGRRAEPENLAYVIYTSGSTGQPKGVGVEHRQLYNYLRAVEQRLELEPGSSYALVSTLAADLGHTVTFGALCAGGGATLHLISQERAGDAAALSEYFRRHEIDYLKIVPSHLRALLEAGGRINPRRGLVLGGEALTSNLVAALEGAGAGCQVFNHYGPTETTVGVLAHRVTPGVFTKGARVPLGRPLNNVRAYALDGALEPVPLGVSGELYIGGAGVGRGYLKRAAATAEKFIPDAFGDSPGARLYRTGDLVRRLPDGSLEFLGRADDQVKIRGYRVELGEVEATLRQHESVRDVFVTACEAGEGSRRLAAYVAPTPGVSLTAAGLRDFARARLPEFMVPTVWVTLDEMPLTPNGKVDRKALPRPEQVRPQTEREYVAPRTADEEAMARLWTDILRVERVGVQDNFFDLGGHSLLATQLVSHIRNAFRVELPLRAVFEAPTVEGLVERVEAIRWAAVRPDMVAAGADGEREVGEI